MLFRSASGSQTAALSAVARRPPSVGPQALAAELEAALIPLNRAASRRALARLAREVKRVMEHLGLDVTRLIRVSYGPFQLGDLPEGAIEEVKLKVLRDQLGKSLAELAGVDFASPLREATPAEEQEKRERIDKRSRKHVSVLRKERDENYDRFVRKVAEFDNYRKRVERERRDARHERDDRRPVDRPVQAAGGDDGLAGLQDGLGVAHAFLAGEFVLREDCSAVSTSRAARSSTAECSRPRNDAIP